jgi:hypothetical protein
MNCQEAQAALGADPKTRDAGIAAHVVDCAACAAYREQMRDLDRVIERALAVPADAAIVSAPSAIAGTQGATPMFTHWRLAASLVASVAIATTVLIASTRESLAEQVVAHTIHEASMLEGGHQRAQEDRVERILANAGLALRPEMTAEALDVSRVASCAFRGHEVPHLVVQTDAGPVTVLVLSNEKRVAKARRFEEGEFQGVIVPAPRGVLAVLGQGAPLDQTVERVLAAIEYR